MQILTLAITNRHTHSFTPRAAATLPVDIILICMTSSPIHHRKSHVLYKLLFLSICIFFTFTFSNISSHFSAGFISSKSISNHNSNKSNVGFLSHTAVSKQIPFSTVCSLILCPLQCALDSSLMSVRPVIASSFSIQYNFHV